MKIQCVIFDCDGTLVDSERLAMTLLMEMAAENGISLQADEATHAFAGVRLHKVVAELEQRHNAKLPDSFIPDYRQRLLPLLEQRLEPMPGIRMALDAINLPRCVASNAPLQKIRICLAAAGLTEYFDDAIFSAYEVNSWKPEPGLFLAAAEAMGFAPEHCVVVEDSLPGLHAGLEAGMTVIAYRRADFGDARVHHINDHQLLGKMIKSLGG